MDDRERIKQILYEYEIAGLIEGDPIKVLSYLADDVIGIGMGEQGFVSSKKEVQDIMMNTIKKDPTALYELEFNNIVVHFMTPSAVNICASVIVKRNANGKITCSGFNQSLSMVFQKKDWYITCVHASPIMLSNASIEAYPMVFADNTLTQLRAEIKEETVELLTSSISGGILGWYIREKEHPLCFVNDSILELLGYTRQEFYDKFKEDVSGIVHPEDKDKVIEKAKAVLKQGDNYEICFRILTKGDTSKWVIEHAKKTIDNSGRDIVLAVLTDVNEIIELQQKAEQQTALLEEQAGELLAQNEELTAQKEELTAQKEEIEEQAKTLMISEERFRIALEKTANIIFDYDIISGNIRHSSAPKKLMDFITNIKEAKESLIIGGTIIEEYQEAFHQAFAEIQNGKHQVECIVKVKLATGKEIWNKISMTSILDLQNNPIRAIGLIEDITKQKEAELAYNREEQYRQAILSDAMGSYIINFTKGVFESCQIQDSRCSITRPNENYDEWLHQESKTRTSDEGRRKFLDTFSKFHIMEKFRNEKTEIKLECHILNPDGSDMWIQTTIRLVIDSTTSEKKGFLYIIDIDKKKQEELRLTYNAERDPLTNLYNRGISDIRIREKLKTVNGIQTGVLIILDVDYFKSINDTYGHPYGDKMLKDIAFVLRNHFREMDVVGRIGGDEFCVFFLGMCAKKKIEDIADLICKNIRDIFIPEEGKPGVSCSIGISMCSGIAKTFEQMYKEADSALYQVKRNGRNGYAFFKDCL